MRWIFLLLLGTVLFLSFTSATYYSFGQGTPISNQSQYSFIQGTPYVYHVEPPNRPPVTTISMTSSSGYNLTNESINLSISIHDPDADEYSFNIFWWLNSVLQSLWEGFTNIDSGNTTKGDNLTAIVTVNDSEDYGINKTASLIVKNSPPQLITMNISSYNTYNYTNDTFYLNWTTHDADDEAPLSPVVWWWIDGVYNSSYDNITVIDPGNMTAWQNWTAIMGLDDGDDLSDHNMTAWINVTNHPPFIDNIVLNTSLGGNYSNETMTAHNFTTDADNHQLTHIYHWYRDDEPLAVLYMPFEGGSNSTWTKDYTNSGSQGNNETVVGATWNKTGGYDGMGAYEFNPSGGSQYINLGESSELIESLEDGFTLFARFKLMEVDRRQTIIGFSGVAEQRNYEFFISKVNRVHCIVADGVLYDACSINKVTLEKEKWYWSALTYHTNGSLVLYVNGSDVRSTQSTVSYVGTTKELHIGTISKAVGSSFNGSIDDVRIYNETLTKEQIEFIANNQSNKIDTSITSGGENWTVSVTANDGWEDGNTVNASLSFLPDTAVTTPVDRGTGFSGSDDGLVTQPDSFKDYYLFSFFSNEKLFSREQHTEFSVTGCRSNDFTCEVKNNRTVSIEKIVFIENKLYQKEKNYVKVRGVDGLQEIVVTIKKINFGVSFPINSKRSLGNGNPLLLFVSVDELGIVNGVRYIWSVLLLFLFITVPLIRTWIVIIKRRELAKLKDEIERQDNGE